MKKLSLFIIFSLFAYLPGVFADEGMWLPLLLEKLNIKDMQEKGLKLSAEDIYSINQASLKDALVIFGGGCTGELISEEGLLITNHHCGYGAIQSHSSVENDYLTDGFWAMSREDELPNPGLSVRFLKRMEDVTDKVLKGVKDRYKEEKRQALIDEHIDNIKAEAVEGTNYKAVIKPFYYGNEYYMFVYEEYTDVRLVGAPPSAIGKFGGDTDNWMWPRHTGDFSLFRIYADKDNKPATYSPDNVPYEPIKHMPISLKGIKKGDFTMVMGYPGSTEQFLTSHAVDLIMNQRNPHRIDLRTKRLEIMNRYMERSPAVRIKYASKYARVSNSWKRWQGENRGLKRLHAIEKKENTQQAFAQWAAADKKRQKQYGDLLPAFEDIYSQMGPYAMAIDYYRESTLAVELLRFASYFERVVRMAEESPEQVAKYANALANYATGFYKDYEIAIDKQVAKSLLPTYAKNVKAGFVPEFLTQQLNAHGNSYAQYVDYLFDESVFADKESVIEILTATESEKLLALKNDPVYQLQHAFRQLQQEKVEPVYYSLNADLDKLYRKYVDGLRKMESDKIFYPDANFTMRIAYGEVKGYMPKDAVEYNYYTTLSGVIDKDDPDVYDYDVPEKLKELYADKDFGKYGEDGEMHVAFIASNHTSGGNSGSPVLNAEGHLIGVNFDRNWEGTMSDIMYDPSQCRNITLDIRYALFIIDKFAGAGHLVDEMTLIE